ncbi:MAG TPA: hypothetical protein VGG94_05530 [Chthoniobacterales bacterium]|jgi:hypothetical protein
MKFIIRYLAYDSLSRLCSQHTCAAAVYNTAEIKVGSVALDRNGALQGMPRKHDISSRRQDDELLPVTQGGMMESTIRIALVICLACSISGCGGYSSHGNGNTPLTQTLAGTWDFTYVSSKSGSATVSGTFTQTNGAFSASVALTGSCAAMGTISGTMSGSAITGTLTEASPETINIMGTLASTGNTASGTYQVMSATDACAAASDDTGTWSGTRTAVPIGPYSAMVRSADRLPVHVILNLDGDLNQLTGTAKFTNSACLHSMKVTGTQTGSKLELRGDSGNDGSILLKGTIDPEAKILTLNSAVSGACQAESGAATFTKMQ